MTAPPRPFTPAAVHTCLRNRDWQLISPRDPAAWERFLDDVAALLRAGDDSPRPANERLPRAVIAAYCPLLHAACAAHGTYEQHRAYTEIWNWLYPILVKRTNTPEDAEDIAQDVLLHIFQNLERVNQPSGFLAHVGGVAHKRLRRYYTQLGKERRRFSYDLPDEDADEPEPTVGVTDPRLIAARMELNETQSEILDILEQCLPRRAGVQRIVFVDLIFRRRSVHEIAEQHELTIESVHKAWSRLRQALRNGCSRIIEKLILYLELQELDQTGAAP